MSLRSGRQVLGLQQVLAARSSWSSRCLSSAPFLLFAFCLLPLPFALIPVEQ
jgi:hypothetical protein